MEALPDLVVNASYSPELGELKEQMDEIKEEVEGLHREARDGWCDFGDKVGLIDVLCLLLRAERQRRWVMPNAVVFPLL